MIKFTRNQAIWNVIVPYGHAKLVNNDEVY